MEYIAISKWNIVLSFHEYIFMMFFSLTQSLSLSLYSFHRTVFNVGDDNDDNHDGRSATAKNRSGIIWMKNGSIQFSECFNPQEREILLLLHYYILPFSPVFFNAAFLIYNLYVSPSFCPFCEQFSVSLLMAQIRFFSHPPSLSLSFCVRPVRDDEKIEFRGKYVSQSEKSH